VTPFLQDVAILTDKVREVSARLRAASERRRRLGDRILDVLGRNGRMQNDPEWANDETRTEVALWKERAHRELERARRAEELVKQLQGTRAREVYAFGTSPLVAILALAKVHGWGEVSNVRLEDEPPGSEFHWGARFLADEGTSFKAAGVNVPSGGVVVTWWE